MIERCIALLQDVADLDVDVVVAAVVAVVAAAVVVVVTRRPNGTMGLNK